MCTVYIYSYSGSHQQLRPNCCEVYSFGGMQTSTICSEQFPWRVGGKGKVMSNDQQPAKSLGQLSSELLCLRLNCRYASCC